MENCVKPSQKCEGFFYGESVNLEYVMDKLRSIFPHSPEADLCLAVVEQTLKDIAKTEVVSIEHQESAKKYLASDMPHAQVCGVSAAEIRQIVLESAFMPSEWRLRQLGEDTNGL